MKAVTWAIYLSLIMKMHLVHVRRGSSVQKEQSEKNVGGIAVIAVMYAIEYQRPASRSFDDLIKAVNIHRELMFESETEQQFNQYNLL